MQVIRAEAMGLCFGVRDALDFIEAVPDPENVTVYGELVHNEKINRKLVQLGFRQVSENGRGLAVPDTSSVLVTAHGVSNAERARLESSGRKILDTTCPLVRRAHEAALHLDEEGYFVVLIGRRGHVEARGLVGDLRSSEIVETPADVRCYSAARIGVVCQTTTTDPLARAVLERIRAMNPASEVRYVDTICRPTRERQHAVAALLPRVDALVVVGGRNSRNSLELAETARAQGVRAIRVESASDLDPAWFQGCAVVGLTAGTSTLDATIDEVHRALLAIYSPPPAAADHTAHEVHKGVLA